jgi:DNA-binding Lrp family transcriptional regulator
MLANAFKLDRIDIRILSQLQKSGRIANVDLADAVGLSPSPCLIRVRRLEKEGFVTGYGAQVEMQMIGNVQLVYTQVTLSDHRREDFDKFEAAIRHIDEIVECHLVSGGDDYLLKFVTTGVAHYQTIIEGLLESHVGIEKYFSYLVIKSPFSKGHYPVENMFSAPA